MFQEILDPIRVSHSDGNFVQNSFENKNLLLNYSRMIRKLSHQTYLYFFSSLGKGHLSWSIYLNYTFHLKKTIKLIASPKERT